jgi:hypothetical protein
MDESTAPASTDKNGKKDKSHSGAHWKIQLGVLCAMLLLALGGMGISQASDKGAWEYWLLVVFVYAGLGLWRTKRRKKHEMPQVRNLVVRQFAPWGVLLGFIAVLLLLERREIVDRQAASDFALMMLALTCCLAGVYFDWLLMVVGIVLTIMVVAMATLQQYTLVLWIFMTVVVLGAAVIIFLKSRE